ncbi:MAG: gliding motility-associated C-terminal domain-containing protein, partial [Saprospiraceae bacterium]|nr:gliding motility-associated C-terminal domain-containing protein [Saprospiraceae bacterium]
PLSTAGTYTEVITSSAGCDSTIVLTLEVLDEILDSITAQICLGQTYTFGTNVLSVTGTYVDTFNSTYGCDSIVTLTLEVLEQLQTNLTDTICQGDTYDFNGQTIASAGSYMQTLTSQAGCDSLVTLDLTVLPVALHTIDTAICEGETFVFNGQNLTTSGTYPDTLIAASGCDSIVTLMLSVDPVYVQTISASICLGSTFEWAGIILDSTGAYMQSFTSTTGCDSVVTLNLTATESIETMIEAQICTGQNYPFGGQLLNMSGTYLDSLTSSGGCDSVVTLVLDVLDQLMTNLDDTICQGDTYAFNGQILSVAGTYQETYSSQAGCDSVVTLELAIINPVDTIINQEICQGDMYDFNGQLLSSSGTYIDTFVSVAGCDSVVTLMLTVHPLQHTTINADICDGDAYDFNGQFLSSAGIYVDTLSTISGCDSIVTLHLNIHLSAPYFTEAQICSGQSYQFGDRTLVEGGIYIDSLISTQGCDSIITLNLEVLDVIQSSISETICFGETYLFEGQSLTVPGIYTESYTSEGGCEMVVTLDLEVIDRVENTSAISLCAGEFYDFNGNLVTSAGTYVDTLVNQSGCDSIVTLQVTILRSYIDTIEADICQGETFNFNGLELSTSGEYRDTTIASNGCDSIAILLLNVLPVLQTNLSANICSGAIFDFHGTLLTSGGSYSDTLSSLDGCDSIITLVLTVVDVFDTTVQAQICSGTSFNFHGQNLAASGTYVDTLVSDGGCDSVVTLVLLVKDFLEVTLTAEICEGETYSFSGNDLSQNGVYSDTTTSSLGCDSITTLSLTVIPWLYEEFSFNLCPGESVILNGVEYNAIGTFIDTLISTKGCDSIITITIDRFPSSTDSTEVDICAGMTYNFAGLELSTSGVYHDTLMSSSGCDSILVLNLQVKPPGDFILDDTICQGDSYNFNEQMLTMTGTYTQFLIDNNGCDSLITLNLTVLPIIATELTDSVCPGYYYQFGDTLLSDPGTYIDTFTSEAGCDSLVILHLNLILPVEQTVEHYRMCDGDSVMILGTWYYEQITLDEVFTGTDGCDSLVTYIVEIIPQIALSGKGAEICVGDSVQLKVSGNEGRPVTWSPSASLSCTDCTDPIASPDTTTTYVVTTLGCGEEIVSTTVTVEVIPYPTLEVSEDQKIKKGEIINISGTTEPENQITWHNQTKNVLICEDCKQITDQPSGTTTYEATSSNILGCSVQDPVTVIVEDLCELEKIKVVNAFTPNGDGINDYFFISNPGISRIGLVQVFNRWGELVFETTGTQVLWDGTHRGVDVNPGVYMYMIEAICVDGDQLFIPGNVTVVR